MFFNQKTQNIIILLGLIVVLISQITQFGSAPRFPTVMPTDTTTRVSCIELTIVPASTVLPTATSWVKQDILIEMKSNFGPGLNVWTDNIATDKRKVNEVEGVTSTRLMHNDHMIYVQIDPRYDKDLVAKAIADRLREKSLSGW